MYDTPWVFAAKIPQDALGIAKYMDLTIRNNA